MNMGIVLKGKLPFSKMMDRYQCGQCGEICMPAVTDYLRAHCVQREKKEICMP